MRQLARVWIDFETRLHQVPIVAQAGDRALHARRLQAALAEPAPAGRRGRALDCAGGLADGRRARSRCAASFITHAREEHRDFRAAGTQLRERRRRRRRDPRRGEERRQRGAVGLDVPPREPGEPVRSPGRDVHHRGARRAAGGALGHARSRSSSTSPTTRSRSSSITAATTTGTSTSWSRRSTRAPSTTGWSTASSRPRR